MSNCSKKSPTGSAPVTTGVVRSIRVEAKPAGVARSADGQQLYVTHLRTGRVSVIDLNRQAVVKVVGTGSDSNMTQRIAIHPDNGRVYLPHIRSNVTNRFRLFDSTVFPVISVLDLRTGTHLTRERIDLSLGLTVANLPFDVQFSADGKQIYVVNLGSGDVMIHGHRNRSTNCRHRRRTWPSGYRRVFGRDHGLCQ